jgi:DNA-binding transcriptional LysR family regulator
MSLAAAVAAGRGVAFSASLAHLAGNRLRYLAIDPPLIATRVGVVFKSDRLPPLVQQFVAVARSLASPPAKERPAKAARDGAGARSRPR